LEPSQDIKPRHQKPLIMRYPKLNGRDIILQFRDHLLKEEENNRLLRGKVNIDVMKKSYSLDLGSGRVVHLKISFKGEKKVIEITKPNKTKLKAGGGGRTAKNEFTTTTKPRMQTSVTQSMISELDFAESHKTRSDTVTINHVEETKPISSS
jgi:hypothetical protein